MSSERELIVDSLNRLLDRNAALVDAARGDPARAAPELWGLLDEAGFLSILGTGDPRFTNGELEDAIAILRVTGERAVSLPILETMLAGWLLSVAGAEPPANTVAVAIGGLHGDIRIDRARGRLSGRVANLTWGPVAEEILVLYDDGDGPCIARIPYAEPGTATRNLAGEPVAALTFDSVQAELIALPNALDTRSVAALAGLMKSAQMSGAMDTALKLAIDYANERVQFGRAIGKFQAVQHMLAVMASQIGAVTAIVDAAARANGAAGNLLLLASAKSRASEAAGHVASAAHQTFGAIGYTKEHSLHHYTRRLWAWRDDFGSETYWNQIIGDRAIRQGGIWEMLTEAQCRPGGTETRRAERR